MIQESPKSLAVQEVEGSPIAQGALQLRPLPSSSEKPVMMRFLLGPTMMVLYSST